MRFICLWGCPLGGQKAKDPSLRLWFDLWGATFYVRREISLCHLVGYVGGELKRTARRPCQRKMLSSRGGEVRAVFVCISIVILGVYLGGILYLSFQKASGSVRMSYFCRANAAHR